MNPGVAHRIRRKVGSVPVNCGRTPITFKSTPFQQTAHCAFPDLLPVGRGLVESRSWEIQEASQPFQVA